ncbi:MAG: hypothetical protein IKM07_07080, partial [Clostridia bacterium]|nr:hypothetical protein [Clostridia bacterium]
MAKQFLFESLHDEKAYRLINQTGVKMAIPPEEGNENYNCCWDGVLSPDGKFYYTLSSEAGKYDHAKLVRYNYENNSIDECMYVGSVANTKTRLMPHSKLHTSINFRPADNKCGYHVIATTHNTDKAPQHPEWMPFAHHTDMWEGFAGSIIVDYDPDTGATENWGVPVPRETIYGAEYDPKHDRLYMIGFMRGHVYSFDCKTRTVTKDLGKAAEVFNFRLSLAPDGNLYGCTKSGAYYRINTETNCLEDLHYQVPYYPGALNNNTWYRYMACAQPTPDGKGMYFANYCAWDLIRFDFDTQEFSIVGSKVPKDGYFPEDFPCIDYHTDAFIVDKYNVIWYQQCISCRDYGGSRERLGGRTTRLFRWDIENGKEPEYLGIVGIPGRYHSLTCEMDYDPETDRIYCVDSGNGFGSKGPAAMCIDLSVYREHM